MNTLTVHNVKSIKVLPKEILDCTKDLGKQLPTQRIEIITDDGLADVWLTLFYEGEGTK